MYTLEQQKANRKLWVEALRSGKYKQGRGKLKLEDRFCCLGVACDLFWTAGWNGNTLLGRDPDREPGLIPEAISKMLGLPDGYMPSGTGSWKLANANDEGTPFAAIADIIESEPPGLFRETA